MIVNILRLIINFNVDYSIDDYFYYVNFINQLSNHKNLIIVNINYCLIL